jgi:hypothetical protein
MAESVRIEWGVKWIDAATTAERYEKCGSEADARHLARQYRYNGARLARREVRRTLWEEVG